MIRIGLTLALLLAGASGASAQTQVDYGQAFVDAFAQACVPGRLAYPTTQQAALDAGWLEVGDNDHPELAAMLVKQAAALQDPDLEITYEQTIYARDVVDMKHHLIVGRSSMVIEGFGENDTDEIWNYVGCYLYSFDAKGPIAPDPITAFTGKPIAREVDDKGMIGYLWGPPCPLPRTGDTYMTYIAEDSPHVELTGFSGLSMKFETSEPDPGEEVPETYC